MQKTTQALLKHCIDEGYTSAEVSAISIDEINGEISAKVAIIENPSWSYKSFDRDVAKIEETGCPCIAYTDGEKFVHIFAKSEEGKYSEVSDIVKPGEIKSIDEGAVFFSMLKKKIWLFADSIRGKADLRTCIGECLLTAVQINRENGWAEFHKVFNDTVDNEVSFREYISGIHGRIVANQSFKAIFSENAVISRDVYASLTIFEGVDFDRFSAQVYECFRETADYRDSSLVNPQVSRVMTSFAKGDCVVISYEGGGFLADLRSNKSVRSVDLYADVLMDLTCVGRYLCQVDSAFTESWIPAKDYDTIIVMVPFGYLEYQYPTESALFGNRRTELVNRVLETALPHLKKDGVLLTIVPEGFMFRSDDTIRKYIADNYHVSVIQNFKKLFGEVTSISTSLLVIDDRKSEDTLVSKNGALPEETDKAITNIRKYLSDGNVPEGGYVLFRNLDLETNWSSGYLCLKAEGEPDDGEERIALGDVCEILSGVLVSSREYLPAGSVGGIPYVRLSDYSPDGICLAHAVRVPGSKARVLSQKGDIVFSTSATIGKMAIVGDELFVPSSQTVLLRCREGYSCHKLVAVLKSEEVSVQLYGMVTGTTIKHISKEALKSLRIRAKEMI